jgi:conjugal transfer pilus assembly protein TraF
MYFMAEPRWDKGTGRSIGMGLGMLAMLAVAGSAFGASAGSSPAWLFYQEREDGWFWYEDPPPPEALPPADRNPPAAPVPSPAAAAPLSVEWLRTQLPVLRDRAIDSPTTENVRAYFYAQRIMMDRAQVFSDKAVEVVQSDPLLDENLRVPFASAAKASFLRASRDAQDDILRSVATKAGLWVFHDAACVHCASQVPVSNELAARYGFKVTYLSRQGQPVQGLDAAIAVRPEAGRQKRLGVTHTPAVMLVIPPSQFVLVAQGATPLNELSQRLVSAAHRQGLIDDETFERAEPTSRGILQTHTLDSDRVDWNDPGQWVPFLRDAILGTYSMKESAP